MRYVMGFVAAVPAANKDLYLRYAEEQVGYFKGLGVERLMESWGEDVPDGTVTDFRRGVKAEPGEVIIFSWQEFPDRAIADTAQAAMIADFEPPSAAETPFDGKRMIFGGFDAIVDRGPGGTPGYLDGSLRAVPAGNRDAYAALSERQVDVFLEQGALRVVEGWGVEVPKGQVTDFQRAVAATDDEVVVFSWVEWPSKAVRDAAWASLGGDPRMAPDPIGGDARRWVFGGFVPLLDR